MVVKNLGFYFKTKKTRKSKNLGFRLFSGPAKIMKKHGCSCE